MKTLENSSATPSKALPNWLIFGLIGIGFIGFLDASYLTISHYTGATLNCSILKGCEQVTNSPYAVILNVPVALLGALYYLTILILSLLYFDTKNAFILKIIAPFTLLGFAASIWFVYLQFFVIKALCQYCMVSALTSTLLFVLGILIFKFKKAD